MWITKVSIHLKSRNLLHTHYIHSPIFFSKIAALTSLAKGAGWGEWRANPSFSATKKDILLDVLFAVMK